MGDLPVNAGIIDAIGKLSVEVIAILALVFIVRWITHQNNNLAKSHTALAETFKNLAKTHDHLAEMVKMVAEAVRKDVKLTEELIASMKDDKCLFKSKNRR